MTQINMLILGVHLQILMSSLHGNTTTYPKRTFQYPVSGKSHTSEQPYLLYKKFLPSSSFLLRILLMFVYLLPISFP